MSEAVQMPERMDEEKLVRIVKNEFETAMGRPDGDIATIRKLAWNRYMRELLGNEEEGESQAMTSDVAEVVDGMMPGLMRIFATADNLCEFRPTSEEDVPGAEQETEWVNHVFWVEQENSFMELFFWIFDAVCFKNGISIAYRDQSELISEEQHTGLTADAIDAIVRDVENGVTMEPIERSDPYLAKVPDPLKKNPGPDDLVEIEVWDVKFRRIESGGRTIWETVPPDEFRISADANKPYTSSARFRGREREVPRSDLVTFGFDKAQVYQLPAVKKDGSSANSERLNRANTADEKGLGGNPSASGTDDPSQDLVLWQEAYVKVDYDGDGRAELRQVFLGGGELLKWSERLGGGGANEVVGRDPFHVLVAKPLPHKFWAKAPVEDEIDSQATTSTLLRQSLNGIYHNNQPGHAVDEAAMSEHTLPDLLTTKIGRIARFNGDPNASHKLLTVPFNAQHSFAMIDYFDQKRKDRHGIHADSEGLTADALKNIQKGVLANMLDISTQKLELVARFMAEGGIKTLLLHLHELEQRNPSGEKVVKLRNKWVTLKPGEWRRRMDMNVNVGLGIGNRESQSVMYQQIADLQEKLVAGGYGNLIVKPKHIYATAIAICKNAKIVDPDKHFENPGEELAPPPADAQEELKKKELEVEQRRQQLDQERQRNKDIEHQLDKREQDLRHQREMFSLEEERERRQDQFAQENEKLRNALAKMQLEKIDSDRKYELALAKSPAEIEEINARAAQARAIANKTFREAEALDEDASDQEGEPPESEDEDE